MKFEFKILYMLLASFGLIRAIVELISGNGFDAVVLAAVSTSLGLAITGMEES
jgi:hypothetical protein